MLSILTKGWEVGECTAGLMSLTGVIVIGDEEVDAEAAAVLPASEFCDTIGGGLESLKLVNIACGVSAIPPLA